MKVLLTKNAGIGRIPLQRRVRPVLTREPRQTLPLHAAR